MLGQEKIFLTIGDEIGFVNLASDMDTNDSVFFCKVIEVTRINNERAYRYSYPDGETARRIIRQSELASHVIRIQVRKVSEPVCLNERSREFFEALKRARSNNLEVFPHWEPDTFMVVNHTNSTEYKVCLKTVQGKVFASCACSDFKYRNRVCKHLAEVLRDTFNGIRQPIGQKVAGEPMRNLMTRLSSFSGQELVTA